MKQEFQMSEEELQAIYDISRNQDPVIFVGVWLGLDSQEKANKLWQIMGDKYGFVWDSAEPTNKGRRIFLAEPKPKKFTEYELLVDDAKILLSKWLACKNDSERIMLAKENKSLQFMLDNDNTTCSFVFDNTGLTQNQADEISDIFGLQFLDNDLGNRSGVETLLNTLGISFQHC